MLKYSFKGVSHFSLVKRLAVLPVLLLLMTVFVSPAFALTSSGGYTITSFDTQVKVQQSNVLDCTETINVIFSEARHGIYRDIPVTVSPKWVINGKAVTKTYHVKVTNISVTDGSGMPCNVESSRNGDNLELKIGDADSTVIGPQTYIIHYNYGIGDDRISEFDEFYFNFIGNEWAVPVQSASFSVVMPAAFDQKKLNVTAGTYGSTDTSAVRCSVQGNTITGQTLRAFTAGEGITMRLELPNGYFTPDKESIALPIFVFCCLIFGSLLLWYLFGRDDPVYVPVEVAPPEGVSSAEAGYIIDGHVDSRDLVSLLIYWADKGNLRIEEGVEKDFALRWERDLNPDAPHFAQLLFTKIFSIGKRVTASQLRYKCAETLKLSKKELINYYGSPERRLFTRSGDLARYACCAFSGIALTLPAMRLSDYGFAGNPLFALAFPLVIGFGLSYLICVCADRSENGTKKAKLIGSIVLYALLAAAFAFVASVFLPSPILPFFGAATAVICGVIGAFARKRTPFGNKAQGELMGLEKFIRLAEKSRIEELVEKDPQIFYHILPYAYALDVTDKWAKQFETITLQPPQWYSNPYGGSDVFNTIYFASVMNHSMHSFGTEMTAVESNNGAGGSGGFGGIGGGGFSGGGFGGGGGGSW